MLIILKENVVVEEVESLEKFLKEFYRVRLYGFDIILSNSKNIESIKSFNCVSKVIKIKESFKLSNRVFKENDTTVPIDNNISIGDNKRIVIAGPCSVESEEQIISVAKSVKLSGASILRGGAFKPRTSPYTFQGMGLDGLKLLKLARDEVNIPIVSELLNIKDLEEFDNTVDIIQIGARNMQNFELLKEVGKLKKPILLKRGFANTIEEWLLSAEYILSQGNENVILCERGIRSFDKYSRNNLDITAIVLIKQLSHLPVIADPSHASGKSSLVHSLSLSSIAGGANGVMVEVHNDPTNALCDGEQALDLEDFAKLMKDINILNSALDSMNK